MNKVVRLQNDMSKRRELEIRVTILENIAAEIRELERKRREQAGPQRIEDSHTEARWQGHDLKNGQPK